MSQTYQKVCRSCGKLTTVNKDGVLEPHQRFADGSGEGAQQSQNKVDCEGGQPVVALPLSA